MTEHNVFRDGAVHVMSRRCATCIFGPRSPVGQDRVDEMVAEADANDSTIVCHSTLYEFGDDEPVDNAACRGYFDLRSSWPLRLADAMGAIEWQEPPPKVGP